VYLTRTAGFVAAGVTCALAVLGCSSGPAPASPAAGSRGAPPAGASGRPRASPSVSPSVSPPPSASPGSPGTPAALPLAGKVVGIDPGHNGGNFDDPDYIDRLIWNGRESETCDTTGTETASGYTEARFNFNVATFLREDLEHDGARVVLTRHSDTGVGPCVTTRAEIINHARADVAIDIHADGGPVSGRGFTVLEPVADGPNDKVITASVRFGSDVRAAMLAYTAMPESNYYGSTGVIFRDDLAGLNLTTVPKILIECGNMPNPADAALLTSTAFQQKIARALTAAIVAFLTGGKV
jgi:N-acetylmuramoyl-L-alanine amidase